MATETIHGEGVRGGILSHSEKLTPIYCNLRLSLIVFITFLLTLLPLKWGHPESKVMVVSNPIFISTFDFIFAVKNLSIDKKCIQVLAGRLRQNATLGPLQEAYELQ